MRTFLLNAEDVSTDDLQRMVRLMRQYYENVDVEQFSADLRNKDSVVLMRDGATVCGFSTVVFVDCTAGGQAVRVMFSGDTVTDEARRNSVALPFAIARVALAKLREAPQVPLYWLLTSKGYKTFR